MPHQFWNDRDDEVLLKLYLERTSVEKIAKIMERPKINIERRVHLLIESLKKERSSTGGYIIHPKPGILIHRTAITWTGRAYHDSE